VYGLLPAIVLAFLVLTKPAYAQAVVTGLGGAIDGDTIDVGHVRIRLKGIDAPERHQTCTASDGIEWRCGFAATNAMQAMLAGERITCHEEGRDRWKRILATCWNVGADGKLIEPSLNERLVLQGLAVSFVRYSHRFDAAETIAKAARAGMWSGKFEMPWDFRRATASLATN